MTVSGGSGVATIDRRARRAGSARQPHPIASLVVSRVAAGVVTLVIVSIVPATLWATVLVGRARSRRAHRSARQVRDEERTSLEALRSIDISNDVGRRAAYGQVSTLVRQHLRDTCGIRADGLTPAEIGPALSARGDHAALVTSVLGACERARYGGTDALGSADACRAAIEQAEQVIATVR